MKNRVLPWAVGVAILGCVLAVSANVTTSKIHDNLNQERHARMVVEQQLQMAGTKIKALEVQLTESQKKLQGIEAIVMQGRSTTSDLQAQLDAMAQEKSRLEAQIQSQQNEPSSKPTEGK